MLLALPTSGGIIYHRRGIAWRNFLHHLNQAAVPAVMALVATAAVVHSNGNHYAVTVDDVSLPPGSDYGHLRITSGGYAGDFTFIMGVDDLGTSQVCSIARPALCLAVTDLNPYARGPQQVTLRPQ